MRFLDLPDLVVIAGGALGADSDAVLDLLDLEAADAALDAARLEGEPGGAPRPDRSAAVLLVELVRRPPLAHGSGSVALLAAAQLLALNGFQIDLDPDEAVDLLTEIAAGRAGPNEVCGWIAARLRPAEPARREGGMFEWLTRREARRRGGEGGGPGPAGPFTRFTPPAREVVTLAQREARELGHDYIGTEHLLLALLAEGGGLAARALASLEVTAGAVTADIERIVGRGQGMPPGPVPFTPRSKKVLELALREALRRRQAAVRPEHVLLALVREGNGMAAKILFERIGDLDRVGQALAALETDELERLRAEVARLRALLERHGIDPGADDADDGGAARA